MDNMTTAMPAAAQPAEAEGRKDGATALGKFKDVDALLAAYNNLEAEFTRRSQRLRELEKVKADAPPAQASSGEAAQNQSDGDAPARCDFHDFGDVGGAFGEDEQPGAVFALVGVRGNFVVRVAFELLGLRADVVRADFIFYFRDYPGRDFIVGKDVVHLSASCLQTHAIIA